MAAVPAERRGADAVATSEGEPRDDLSTRRHRLLIGVSGAVLPFLLYFVAGWRPTNGLPRWGLLGSLSAYYYTGAVAVFVGFLVALAAFLVTYRGYGNRYRTVDYVMACIAAAGAVVVAFFPTDPPNGLAGADWWSLQLGVLHGAGAMAMFVSFTVFALFLFPQTQPGSGRATSWRESVVDWLQLFVFWKPNPRGLNGWKLVRNYIYLGCGLVMLGCLVATPLAGLAHVSIIWFEFIAWECFAVCWLVKGRVDGPVVVAARAVGRLRA
ncbi:MAG: hypothetical protein U0446_06205 [Dehalococcoidia bacterium]